MTRAPRLALGALLTVISLAAFAPPALAQAPSLTGESLETVSPFGTVTFGEFTCDKNGTTTIPFTATGLALGPYTGTFTETGSFTIGPQTNTEINTLGVGPILDFEAEFTIDSDTPAGTVTGTKTLAATAPTVATLEAFGRCDPDGSTSGTDVFAGVIDPFVVYTAQINSELGNRTDTGTGSVLLQTTPPALGLPFFQEVFNSTQPEPPGECVDVHDHGSGEGTGHDEHGNGLGKGHLKHCEEA